MWMRGGYFIYSTSMCEVYQSRHCLVKGLRTFAFLDAIWYRVISLFILFGFLNDFLFLLKLLWSFISAQLGEDETKTFRLTQAIPGASKILDYESNSTFEESGLANSMISVTWDWVWIHCRVIIWDLKIFFGGLWSKNSGSFSLCVYILRIWMMGKINGNISMLFILWQNIDGGRRLTFFFLSINW